MGAYGDMTVAVKGQLYGNIVDTVIENMAAQEDIAFGDAVFGYVGEANKAYKFYNDFCSLAFDADFVTSNSIVITVNGVAASTVTFATDHDTTAGLVVDAINALDGVTCSLDPDDTDNRTFRIWTEGATITVSEAVTGGGSQATGTPTYSSAQVFRGVALFNQSYPEGYEQYDTMAVISRGQAWVLPATAVEASQVAYVDNATTDIQEWTVKGNGVEVGGIYRSNGDSSTLCRVEITGQTQMTSALEI